MINLILSIGFVMIIFCVGFICGCFYLYKMYWKDKVKKIESNIETRIDIGKCGI